MLVEGEDGRHVRRRSIMFLSDVLLRAVRYEALIDVFLE